jgi:hypothetical protein
MKAACEAEIRVAREQNSGIIAAVLRFSPFAEGIVVEDEREFAATSSVRVGQEELIRLGEGLVAIKGVKFSPAHTCSLMGNAGTFEYECNSRGEFKCTEDWFVVQDPTVRIIGPDVEVTAMVAKLPEDSRWRSHEHMGTVSIWRDIELRGETRYNITPYLPAYVTEFRVVGGIDLTSCSLEALFTEERHTYELLPDGFSFDLPFRFPACRAREIFLRTSGTGPITLQITNRNVALGGGVGTYRYGH